MIIATVHIPLRPYSPQHLLALIEGLQLFEEQGGLRASEGLRDFLVCDEVFPA